MKSKGLGDSVAQLTKKTGLDKLITKAYKRGCDGCGKRQQQLNELFPYSQKRKK